MVPVTSKTPPQFSISDPEIESSTSFFVERQDRVKLVRLTKPKTSFSTSFSLVHPSGLPACRFNGPGRTRIHSRQLTADEIYIF